VAIAGESSLRIATASSSSKTVDTSLQEDLHVRSVGYAVVIVKSKQDAVLVVDPQHGVGEVAIVPAPQLVRVVA
jgi:hypothetical protein